MNIFAGLKGSGSDEEAEIYIVSQEDLDDAKISPKQFFQGFGIVIQVPEEIFSEINGKVLLMALKAKKGGPEDLLRKEG